MPAPTIDNAIALLNQCGLHRTGPHPRGSRVSLLALLLVAGALSSGEAQAAPGPAKTLGLKQSKLYAKAALRTEYTVKRYASKRCKRLSRLRVRCRPTFRDDFDNRYRATVDVSRIGNVIDDRERFKATVRLRGTSTKKFTGDLIEETRRATLGQTLTLIGQDEDRVRVTPGRLIDPLPSPSEFEAPPPGARYVAVPLTIENVGAGRFEDSLRNGSKLITTGNTVIETTIIVTPPCDQGAVEIPERETRIGCVAFAVPFGTPLRAFEYGPNSGFAPETGQWRIGP